VSEVANWLNTMFVEKVNQSPKHVQAMLREYLQQRVGGISPSVKLLSVKLEKVEDKIRFAFTIEFSDTQITQGIDWREIDLIMSPDPMTRLIEIQISKAIMGLRNNK
jgi:hypothetical protein